MDTEPQEENVMDQVIEAAVEVDHQDQAPAEEGADHQPEPVEEKRVPVSAVQKERKKRQEAEAERMRAQVELNFYREQMQKSQAPVEDDDTQYESLTRGEYEQKVKQDRFETKREISEDAWKSANPEKAQEVDDNLAEFLQQRPHLGAAISSVTNRYAEAYTLMKALSPKQQAAIKQRAAEKPAPGSPNGMPKAAAINQVVDVMDMNDEEYRAWRQSKKSRR